MPIASFANQKYLIFPEPRAAHIDVGSGIAGLSDEQGLPLWRTAAKEDRGFDRY
jgi:hypothetical protein